MPSRGEIVLKKMLDRLMAGLLNGPALNCRPHASRQRIDLTTLSRLQDLDPNAALCAILGADAKVKLTAKVLQPATDESKPAQASDDDDARKPWREQQAVVNKLRAISEDARTYEQDTGVHVLNIGYPLLRLPSGALSAGRKVLAPIAFIPIAVTIRRGAKVQIELACRAEGVDRVAPNTALLAWMDQVQKQTSPEMFADEEGEHPWAEVAELVRLVARRLDIAIPSPFGGEAMPPTWAPTVTDLNLRPAPKSDDPSTQPQIVNAAVLGLYPMANQGLINDMTALASGEPTSGPIESFLNVDARFYDEPAPPPASEDAPASPAAKRPRKLGEERLVSQADPGQARAVTMSRTSKGLVIHGPPGTGKSQTITNVIGDHLARGERVLFVCDKRTALDVVHFRLKHLELGDLCAVVHDPQRDQRELYREIRGQVEELASAKSNKSADKELAQVDAELVALHAKLGEYRRALMDPPHDGEQSLHELMGTWLSLPEHSWKFDTSLSKLDYADYRAATIGLGELFRRAQAASFAENPWRTAANPDLPAFLHRTMADLRESLGEIVQRAQHAAALADSEIQPFAPDVPLLEQGQRRVALAGRVKQLVSDTSSESRQYWAAKGAATAKQAGGRFREIGALVSRISAGAALDVELFSIVRDHVPDVQPIAAKLGALNAYLEIAGKWYAFLQPGRKSAASAVLREFGLTLSIENATRTKSFLEAVKDRKIVAQLLAEIGAIARFDSGVLPEDDVIERAAAEHLAVVSLLNDVQSDPMLHTLRPTLVRALADASIADSFVRGLEKSGPRARALDALRQAAQSEAVFARGWVKSVEAHMDGELFSALAQATDTIEDVIRVTVGLQQLPPALAPAASLMVDHSVAPDEAIGAMRRTVLSGEITRRLDADPQLQSLDERNLRTAFDRYVQLDAHKKTLVRDSILHRWRAVQKERLLASTGSRLNSLGADVKRRFTMSGQRAMRLRRVIELGCIIEDGDPLFDLRPIWMASPETVAQLFARQPIFDVVIFDEASQCRLEEALPVLTRAKRVVIAGDPQQLPPTRFFESAVVSSDESDEVESDQQLFESRQSQTEDLLAAALNLDVHEAYLDVHYRSRNSDLIAFSNEHFYHKRLQTIPGHPRNLAKYAPLTIDRANGVYEDGENPIEAERVCQIVRELLHRADPPSIGVACFNVSQRDLILEKLEDLAAEDEEFASKLASARTRNGKDSFEGLFVRNLENVQGDERDHIIISTTYGPDAKGKFYRRFGPLLRVGGGRRLNVLITRARQEVHLVTSIPSDAYRGLEPVPPGTVAGGAWLLFGYLRYAEELNQNYEIARRVLNQTEADATATVGSRPTGRPSAFAAALARLLADKHNIGSQVHWGNDGFCIDVALSHPRRAEDVTIGILCDATRFDQADDMVEWDIFQAAIHESQGWQLHRVWTPHFFRDPHGHVRRIVDRVNKFLASEPPDDSIAVASTNA